MNKRITCVCGSVFLLKGLSKHLKTKKHKISMENTLKELEGEKDMEDDNNMIYNDLSYDDDILLKTMIETADNLPIRHEDNKIYWQAELNK